MSVPRRTTTSRLEAGSLDTGGAWTSGADVPLTESPTDAHPDEAFLDNADDVTPPAQTPYSLGGKLLVTSKTWPMILPDSCVDHRSGHLCANR